MASSRILAGLIASVLFVGAQPLFAASFTISTASTTARTLGTASGETGTITSGGSLTLPSGNSTVAVTISGNNATLTNDGSIVHNGTGRVIRDNTGVTGLLITNGSVTNSVALMQAADADVIQMNKTPASVTLNNYGTMTSLNASKGGAQAVDFNAILSGSNIINNFATGLLKAQDADAVRPGVNGVVTNDGIIRAIITTDTGSDGIDAQANSGISITNANLNLATNPNLIEGARHGITGGGGSGNTVVNITMSVTNNSNGIIRGNDGAGINIDGFSGAESVTVINNGTITGNGLSHDGDGIDVDGVIHLTNTGLIKSLNSFIASGTETSEGVTVGGGTIINSGTIEGAVANGNTTAIGRGITLAGVDKDSNGNAIPIQGIYANSTITNQTGGLIKGQSDSGIAVGGPASGFIVTITNQTGATIQGGGATAAAIQTGADNDTVNNAGTIKADTSGKAIDLGAGDDQLRITGGAASIVGDVNGGTGTNTLTIDPGAGKAFGYANSISNFSTVEVKSGTATLSGVSTFAGVTKLTGGLLTLDGANRLSAATELDLSGGNLKIIASGPNGQTFAKLTLEGDATIDLALTSLTFDDLGPVTLGDTLAIVNFDDSASSDYAFRFLGDFTSNPDFRNLVDETTINGGDAWSRFDGTYTDVIPEPSTFVFGLVLVGMLGCRQRCRGGDRAPV